VNLDCLSSYVITTKSAKKAQNSKRYSSSIVAFDFLRSSFLSFVLLCLFVAAFFYAFAGFVITRSAEKEYAPKA